MKRICLACRTLYDADERCPGGRGHVVVELRQGGRHKLLDEVWGPDSRARSLRNAAKAGAGGGGFGSLLEGCSGCEGGEISGEAAAIFLAIVVFALVAVVLYWAIKQIIELVREWRDTPKPHGALLPPPRGGRVRVVGTGTVLPGVTVPTPWAEGRAAAYAFELHAKSVFGGSAMLRDARTVGFDVKLDDGRVVRVPAGRIHVRGKAERASVDDRRLSAFLGEIDPDRANSDSDPFPHDFARGLVVCPGDRVDVLGKVDAVADPSGARGYRDSAMMLAPVGTPVVRVRARSGDEAARVRVDAGPPPGAEDAPDSLAAPEVGEGEAASKRGRSAGA